ncbi:hypothetical protein OG342_16985 [Streptomyces bobili]|uniref:hypothetical protein n=1 Tax=Streptomyces bobili TaxID=67280 RepID=UPI00224ED419|nr:hypothetical protein [Streptomyces bobili]MCX5524542.1 hypothetical protein [Streptomyces bobili]
MRRAEVEPVRGRRRSRAHVRRRNGDGYEDRFAQWLAERIGQKVVGPPQHA